MALLDRAMRSVAQSLIGKFGTSVTVDIVEQVQYDTTLGLATATHNSQTVSAVVGRWSARELDGDVDATDVKLLVPAKGVVAPTNQHRATVDGVEYEVVMVDPMYSGEEVAYYVLGLRR